VIKSLGIAASAIALATMAAPASAQQWHGPYYGHHDHDDTGAVVGALIAGGILGALIGAASKKKSEPVVVADAPPPPPPVEGAGAPPPPPPPAYNETYDEESATDRCASAAEEEGSHYARIAQVDRVTSVERNGSSWIVEGSLRLADSLRDRVRTTRSFRCALKFGAAPQVTLLDVGA
jgi:hypothetical protein